MKKNQLRTTRRKFSALAGALALGTVFPGRTVSTVHGVMSSPWSQGKGDVLLDLPDPAKSMG